MTVANTARTAGPYAGVGTVSIYPFAFKVFLTSDVLVQLTSAAGVLSTGTLGTDYSVSLSPDQNGSPGGNVILTVALPSGASLTIGSNVPLSQTVVLTNPGGWYPQVVSDALDKVTILIQQALSSISGAIRIPEIGSSAQILPAAAARAGNVLAFDGNGNPVTVAPATGSSTALALSLADTTTSTKNSGQIGFTYALAYAAGTLGAWLKNLVNAGGAAFIGFIQAATGAVLRNLQLKVAEIQSVTFEDFGAVGDGVTDDTAAMQAAINWVCRQNTLTLGTGGARLLVTAKKFRFTNTLYYGAGFVMEGFWGGGYPYPGTNANVQTSILWADFGGSGTAKWALDTQCFHSAGGGGGRILYNEWVDGNIDGTAADGFNSTHGVSIKGVLLMDANGTLQTNVLYGSLRLVGCPNANVENVTIFGFGYSITPCCSFGSQFKNITSQTNYYGMLAYNANNGIKVSGQFDKIVSPASLAVPVGVIPSWMPSAAAFTGASFNMDGRHYQSSKGFTVAAAQAVGSNACTADVILQYWDDATFLYNSYATTFTNLYGEQIQHDIVVSAYASYNILNLHNFSTAAPLPCTGDFGYQSIGEINVGGNNTALQFARNIWGSVSAADPTYILAHNIGQGGVLPATQRLNKLYEEGTWTPTVAPGSGAITTVGAVSGAYTKVGRLVTVTFDCTITTNGTGAGNVTISGLPYACRAIFSVGSGREVGVSGKQLTVVANPGASTATCFFYDGTYPGANAARLVGTITYPV